MKQIIVLKLETTPEHYQALIETVEAFNRGCGYVADVAFERRISNKIAIQPFVYGSLRAEFGLSSQMAVRAISKCIEAYKRDKTIKPTFAPHGAMVYDERIMSFQGVSHVSLLTLSGRVLVALRFGDYQASRLDRRKGQADLILRDSVFYLYVTVDLPTPPPIEPRGVIGVDLGIVEIASDSEGNQYSGAVVKAVRQRVKEHRRQLQKRKTRSAFKRLRQTRRRQSRFVRDTNHRISKELVQRASSLSKALALEDLSGIGKRANGFGRQMRWLLGNWAFDQLPAFVSYKAEAAGVRSSHPPKHVCLEAESSGQQTLGRRQSRVDHPHLRSTPSDKTTSGQRLRPLNLLGLAYPAYNTTMDTLTLKEQILSASPDVMGGTPVFAGTRVPVQTLLDYVEAGDSIDDFLDGFPTVRRAQVIGFLEEAKERLIALVARDDSAA